MSTNLSTEVARIKATLIDIQTAIQNLASKQQLSHIFAIRQQEIQEMKERIEELETQVELLQKG